MKFTSILSLGAALAFVGFASATPSPQAEVTHYCNGPNNLECPIGWRCCGPITQNGGICHQGTKGPCPL